MKIKDVDKKFNDANEALIKLIEARNNASKQAEDLKAQAEEAAVSGDLDQYKKLKAQADDLEAFVYVQGKQIEKIKQNPAVSNKDVSDAWEDYVKTYDKDLKAKLDRFHEAKNKLLKEFVEMVDMQNNALATRERLASYIGKEKVNLTLDGGLGSMFPMNYIPCIGRGIERNGNELALRGTSVCDPDAVYYLNSLGKKEKLYDSIEEQTIKNVLVWRISR